MTIEEFREFGWKAGMMIGVLSNGKMVEAAIDSIDFDLRSIVVAWSNGRLIEFGYDEILSVRNPDGTVAWRAK